MRIHKFLCRNPCGPCEWHIKTAVKTFACFDLIYQAIFVIPLSVQFYTFWTEIMGDDDKDEGQFEEEEEESECDPTMPGEALAYAFCDIINISLGVLTDFVFFASALERNYNLLFAYIFLFAAITREVLHISAFTFNFLRCGAETYPYEIITRLMCQYLIWGIWIAIEYIHWLTHGQRFIPDYHHKEPDSPHNKKLHENSVIIVNDEYSGIESQSEVAVVSSSSFTTTTPEASAGSSVKNIEFMGDMS